MKLVSACLLGINCKYNGKNNRNKKVLELAKREILIPICPEQMGGLPTPRKASSLTADGRKIIEGRGKVLNKEGKDVTKNFLIGAKETLKIAKIFKIKEAILKEGSPSCGTKYTYFVDGKKKGMGVTAALLKKNGIKLISEEELERF